MAKVKVKKTTKNQITLIIIISSKTKLDLGLF